MATLALFAGCNPADLAKAVASEEDERVATECIGLLFARNFSEIEARLNPKVVTPELRSTLQRMADMLPPEKPDKVTLVGAAINSSGGVRTANLSYQYQYGARYFLINCATTTQENSSVIDGLAVQPVEKSVEKALAEAQRFDFKNKSASQYGVFFGALFAAVLTVVALIYCVMESNLRRKWLWVLFIIFGIGDLTVNWSTGESTFAPVAILLFSAGMFSSGYGPFEVSLGIPVGAIAYLVRRFRNHRTAGRSNEE